MKVKEYLEKMNKLTKEHPEALEHEVVYAKDDEGNAFYPIVHNPTMGYYDDYEFYDVDYMMETKDERPPNAVCVN
jgi:hypothetical protein